MNFFNTNISGYTLVNVDSEIKKTEFSNVKSQETVMITQISTFTILRSMSNLYKPKLTQIFKRLRQDALLDVFFRLAHVIFFKLRQGSFAGCDVHSSSCKFFHTVLFSKYNAIPHGIRRV